MSAEETNVLVIDADERSALVQISAGEPPYSQRAQALLALADGAPQAEVVEQSNLTVNQVRYWLGRFRSRGLTVFPEGLITAVAEAEEVEEVDTFAELIEEAAETVVVEEAAVDIEGVEAAKPKKKKSAKKKEKKSDSKKKKAESKKKDKIKAKKKKSESKKKKDKKVKKKKDSKDKKKKSKPKKSKTKKSKPKKTKSKKKQSKKK